MFSTPNGALGCSISASASSRSTPCEVLPRSAASDEQPRLAPRRRAHQVDAVVAYIGILRDPAQCEPAVEYASTAMAVIDSVWSIGVRYQGVLTVLERYRRLRAASGADPEGDTPADLVSY